MRCLIKILELIQGLRRWLLTCHLYTFLIFMYLGVSLRELMHTITLRGHPSYHVWRSEEREGNLIFQPKYWRWKKGDFMAKQSQGNSFFTFSQPFISKEIMLLYFMDNKTSTSLSPHFSKLLNTKKKIGFKPFVNSQVRQFQRIMIHFLSNQRPQVNFSLIPMTKNTSPP